MSVRVSWKFNKFGNNGKEMIVVDNHGVLGGFACDCIGETVYLDYSEVFIAMVIIGEDGGSCKIDDRFVLLPLAF